MNLLSMNMAHLEVFTLQKHFPSLNLPGQCDIKICQVHVVSLQDEVTIVKQVFERFDTKVDPVALFLSNGVFQEVEFLAVRDSLPVLMSRKCFTISVMFGT